MSHDFDVTWPAESRLERQNEEQADRFSTHAGALDGSGRRGGQRKRRSWWARLALPVALVLIGVIGVVHEMTKLLGPP